MYPKSFDDFDAVTPEQAQQQPQLDGGPAAEDGLASPFRGVVAAHDQRDAILESQAIAAMYLAEITRRLELLRMRMLAQLEKSQRLLDKYAENAVEPAD